MEFVYNDGGRKDAGYKGDTSDCVTRSIAIITGKPYKEVYDQLNVFCKKERPRKGRSRSTARSGIKKATIRKYLKSLGFTWKPTMGIGTGCTVHLADGELPAGRLIVSVSKHLTAVIDGVIHDTHDPQRENYTTRIFPGWETAELKTGEWRNVEAGGRGIHSISRRCVYGYWIKY